MEYIIKHGDTIRMIAQRELGDAGLWTEIVSLNNLIYPYIAEQSGVGVVSAGDVILLPVQEQSALVEPVTSFGSDLLLNTDKFNLTDNKGGDLQIGVDGDYEIVSELDCLKQDLAHRHKTPLGTLPYHESYGSQLPTLIGSKKDSSWRTKAALEIERTAKCDPRITSINSLVIEDLSTGLHIKYTGTANGIKFNTGGVEVEEI